MTGLRTTPARRAGALGQGTVLGSAPLSESSMTPTIKWTLILGGITIAALLVVRALG